METAVLVAIIAVIPATMASITGAFVATLNFRKATRTAAALQSHSDDLKTVGEIVIGIDARVDARITEVIRRLQTSIHDAAEAKGDPPPPEPPPLPEPAPARIPTWDVRRRDYIPVCERDQDPPDLSN
jgi:hypothetical protein